MADSKITALTSIGTSTDPSLDQMVIVDTSDGSMAATGTTKKVSLNQLLSSNPSATGGLTLSGTLAAGSATITGDLTVRTNKLYVTSTGVGCGMTPITPLSVSGAGGIILFRTTDPSAPVASPYIIAPVSTGFSSTSPVYGYWYQSSGIGNPAVDTVSVITASSERYRIAADGVATWSNVGGVAGTAMTLNSGGLGVGIVPSAGNGKLQILGGVNYDGQFNLTAQFVDVITSASKGVLLGYNNTTNNGIIAAAYGGGTEGLTFWTHNGSSWGQRMELTATGNVGIGVTPSAGGGCLQLKSGITFPATQVASSDVNTLDDYEEGSFTPTPNSGTFSAASAKYTKIGNMVTVFFDLTIDTGGGSQITNLPFTAASTSTVANGIYTNNQTYAAGTTAPVVVVGGSGTVMYFRTVGTGVAFSAMSFTAGANLTGTISYFV